MNVGDLFLIIKKNIVNIILWGIGVMLFMLLVATFFVKPKYSSNIDVLVNQKTDNTQAQYTAQQTDLQAINTYKDILKKPVVLQPVLKKIKEKNNYQGSLNDLQKSISIGNETNSQVLTVTVKGTNAYVTSDTANIIGKVFSKKIKNIMKIDNVSIVSKAIPNTSPVFPNKKIFGFIGLILGFFIGLTIAIIRYAFDTTVKDNDFLTKDLGLVTLGSVYHIPSSDGGYHAVYLQNNNTENRKYRRV